MQVHLWRVPELIVLWPALYIQWTLARWLLAWGPISRSARARYTVRAALAVAILWLLFGFIFSMSHAARLLPYSWWLLWIRGAALVWALSTAGMFLVGLVWRSLPRFDPGRRAVLRAVGTAALASPVAAVGFAILVERTRFRLREIDLRIPGLPKDLENLRLVQISDIHLSPFLSERDLERAVAMANETRAHVALVTGDLVTTYSDPLESCLRALARLRADAGVLGCLGNHEIFAQCEDDAERLGARRGIRFLRGRSESLRFGEAWINFAGVDYQPIRSPYLIGAARLRRPGQVNVLLSHNPDVFPVAARQRWDLTISGHTHGGQVTVEFLHQYLNVARFFTPFVYGSYQLGPSSLYVTRGIGTVGIPLRFGAPPEIAMIRLCAISS